MKKINFMDWMHYIKSVHIPNTNPNQAEENKIADRKKRLAKYQHVFG